MFAFKNAQCGVTVQIVKERKRYFEKKKKNVEKTIIFVNTIFLTIFYYIKIY